MLVDGKRKGKATAERERERRTGGVMWKMATYWSGARGGREGGRKGGGGEAGCLVWLIVI